MMFEVLETSWGTLQERLDSARTLDDIIDAHSTYLSDITGRALLHPDSKDVSDKLEEVCSCRLCPDKQGPFPSLYSGSVRTTRTRARGGARGYPLVKPFKIDSK